MSKFYIRGLKFDPAMKSLSFTFEIRNLKECEKAKGELEKILDKNEKASYRELLNTLFLIHFDR